MKILTLKQRLRFVIILFIIIIILITVGVVYPTTAGILNLQKEIKVTEVFLETQYQKSRRLSSKDQNFDEILSQTTTFETLTIDTEAELSLIQTFEEIAELNTIDQNLSVRFEETPHETVGFPYYEFTFLNHGLYADHIAYLHTIGSLPYIVDIDQVDLQGKIDATNNTTNVSLRITARIYAKEK